VTGVQTCALPISEGARWLDLIAGICVNNVGHSAPEVLAAIEAQSRRYLHPHVYGEAVMSPQVRYATRLAGLLGPGFEQVYFGNSGAEAIEGAIKIARKYTGRQELVAFKNAYHGSTYGALSVSGYPARAEGYGPLLPAVKHLPYNDFAALSQITRDTAGVVVEAIQGAGGVVLPAEGFLPALRRRCDQTGTLLILDEIQTGFGRTGSLFAFQQAGFRPDILVLAKALGGGLPLGAFVTRPEVMRVIQRDPPLGHISTFGGHPLSCAAGLAALEKLLAEDLLAQVPAKEALMRRHLQHPAIVELRGQGLLYGLFLKDYATATAVMAEALTRGLVTIGFLNVDHGIRLSPPLTITEAELAWACEQLLAAIEAVQG
jgi:acetylornithine/N-succinyldiaminopimelate aminotransferase